MEVLLPKGCLIARTFREYLYQECLIMDFLRTLHQATKSILTIILSLKITVRSPINLPIWYLQTLWNEGFQIIATHQIDTRMEKKLIKHKSLRIVVVSLSLFIVCCIFHMSYIKKNIYGDWKLSGKSGEVPDFLYIEETQGTFYSKGFLYLEGSKYAIPLLCTDDNLIIFHLHNKSFGRYSRKWPPPRYLYNPQCDW